MPPALAELTARAQTLSSAGDLAGARALLDRALPAADTDPRNATPDLATAAALQARILSALGDPHAARIWAGFAHAALERLHGPQDDRTLAAAALHAAVLTRVGSHGRAAHLYHDLVGRLIEREGRDSAQVIAAEADLATAEHAAGQCTAARSRLAEAWARHRRVFGDAEAAGIKMVARLGAMERECGLAGPAREHLALAQELCARHLPVDHPLAVQLGALASAAPSGRHACGQVRRSEGPESAGPPAGSVHRPVSGVSAAFQQPAPGITAAFQQPAPGVTAAPRQPAPGANAAPHQPGPGVAAAPHQPGPGVAAAPHQPAPGVTAAPHQPEPGVAAASQQSAAGVTAVPRQPVPGVTPVDHQPGGGVTSQPYRPAPADVASHPPGAPPGPHPAAPGPMPDISDTGPIVGLPPSHAATQPAGPPLTPGPVTDISGTGPTGDRTAAEPGHPVGGLPAPDERPTDPRGSVYQAPLYLSDVHRSPGDLTGRHDRADTPLPPPGRRVPEYTEDGHRVPVGSAPVEESLLPVPLEEEPPPRPSRQGFVLAAVVVAGIGVAAAVVAVTLPRDETPTAAATTAPAASRPAATTPAPTTPAVPGAPTDVRLRDNRDSVSLTWTYPDGAEGPVLISGGRTGQDPRAFQQLPAGAADYVVYGLNEQSDYCFTVAVVYSTDRIASSGPVCTRR